MAARTVLHGIDQSVPSYARLPGKGHWAHEVLTEDLLNRFTYDGNAGLYRPVGQINFLYDFAVQGGAAGDIVLPVKVPANTIITHGLLDVLVQPTSGGLATVAIEIEAAADVLAATAIASLTTGLKAIKPVLSDLSKAIKTTEERTITVVVATADLTAGKIFGTLFCSNAIATPAAG